MRDGGGGQCRKGYVFGERGRSEGWGGGSVERVGVSAPY